MTTMPSTAADMRGDAVPTASLYSGLPYPDDGVVRTWPARLLAQELRRMARPRPCRLLDLGCGTGEVTVGLAKQFPGAKVLGVDVNQASLERAEQLAAATKISNVSFAALDLEQPLVDQLTVGTDRLVRFSAVTAFGVLHHLDDPPVALRHLSAVIEEDALLLGFVYSRFGRTQEQAVRLLLDRCSEVNDVVERAEFVDALGLSLRHSFLGAGRELHRRLRYGSLHEVVELTRILRGRRRLTHLSDTFSNPLEHLFTFGELRQLMAAGGWQLDGLAEHGGLPTSPERFTRKRRTRSILRGIDGDAFADAMALRYQAPGFTFIASRPHHSPPPA